MWDVPASNPEGQVMLSIAAVVALVDVVAFLVRIYSRYINGIGFRDASDIVLLFALICIVGLVVIAIGLYSHGYGEDIDKFTPEDLQISYKIFTASDVIWSSATTAIRTSLLLLYLQVFSPVRKLRLTAYAICCVNILNWIAIVVAGIAICSPVSFQDVISAKQHCGDLTVFESYSAVITFVLDAAVATLPMPTLWSLRLPRSKKIGITLILGLGYIVCALTIVRIVIAFTAYMDSITKKYAIIMFIILLEPMLGFLITCLPFFPGVWHHIRNKGGSRLGPTNKSGTETVYKSGDEMELGLRRSHPSVESVPQSEDIKQVRSASPPLVPREGRTVAGTWVDAQRGGIRIEKDFRIEETTDKASRKGML